MLTDTLLTIINGNADGILVVDGEGAIRFANPAAERMFGQSASALIGEVFGFPLSGGETTEIDLLPRGAGERISVEMRVVEIDWLGERAYLASLRDMTERKLAEAAILLRNRAIEASASGVLIVEARGSGRPIVYANQAMEALTGYNPHDLIERDCHFLWECNPDGEVNALLDRALIEGRNAEAAVACERKDGASYDAEMRLSPIRSESGLLTHFVAVLHDISARKLLEAEQIERERISVALDKERELRELKDRFLSMMSHELRTPLALIRLSHDMLSQYADKASDEDRRQYLDNIRVQVEHLTEMISEVMMVSRAERLQQDFMPEIMDMITYCRAIVEEFQLTYHRTHRIEFKCTTPIMRAPVDRRLLRQALTNLLANAIKYSPDGGEVVFSLFARGHSAVIELRDNGMGISEEDQARVYEPFHRGANAETMPGTGLGLTIVHEAIKAHGGTIALSSTLGRGSTFTITLPIVSVKTGVGVR